MGKRRVRVHWEKQLSDNPPGLSHIFDDPKKKSKMISLRRKGLSYLNLARMYKVHHSTIVYHCINSLHKNLQRKKYGLKKDIEKLLSSGYNLTKIGREYGVSRLEIEKCCEVIGVAWYKRCLEERKKKETEKKENRKFLTTSRRKVERPAQVSWISYRKTPDPERPGWEKDSAGIWYNVGQLPKEREEELKRRKRQEQEQIRKELLSF